MTSLRFVLAQSTFIAFGAFMAFAPGVRTLTIACRVAIAFLTGSVLLTAEAILFSTVGVRWNAPPLALPLIALSMYLVIRWRRTPSTSTSREEDRLAIVLALLIAVVPMFHAAASFAIARGVSADYVYFWGVKAARFVAAKGLDPAVLGWRYFAHAVPDYPPLVSIVYAWGAPLADDVPWTLIPATSAMWLAAAALVIHGFMAAAPVSRAVPATLFWFTALSISVVHSFSGGNAEAPLVAFVSVACTAVILEPSDRAIWQRMVAAVALAGAVLTKVEGIVPWAGLVAGTVARDWYVGRPRRLRSVLPLILLPSAALALWFTYQWRSGLPVGYRGHGILLQLFWRNLPAILENFPRNLTAGTWGLSWIVPLLVIVSGRPGSIARVLPALTAVGAMFAFFIFDYLHDIQAPVVRISWTLSRISQPALSMWILAAAVATGTEKKAVEDSSAGAIRRSPRGEGATAPVRRQEQLP